MLEVNYILRSWWNVARVLLFRRRSQAWRQGWICEGISFGMEANGVEFSPHLRHRKRQWQWLLNSNAWEYRVIIVHRIYFDSSMQQNVLGVILTTPMEFENGVFTLKRTECFPSVKTRRRNSKTQQSPVILDSCLRETRSGKSRDYRDAIVFGKLRFQNILFYDNCRNSRALIG